MTENAKRSEQASAKWLAGTGAMGVSIESKDWSVTPLGDIEHWPQSLRSVLGICLNSPRASCVAWGPSRMNLYNDRYRIFRGREHPSALGQDFAECWSEVWPAIQPAFERASAGETAFIENQPVLIDIAVEPHETRVNFSFVPVRDESGDVGGIFVSIVDATPMLELQRAGKDHEAFTYALGHDLRSPLRSMEEMARLMLEDHGPQLPEDVRLFLEGIVRTAAKLGARTNGLLSFSRVSHQALARKRVPVQALVEGIVAELSRSTQRRVDVVVSELPDALGDLELVRQVFVSLLSNAFKFTRRIERPRIAIGARRQGNRIEYSISDNGAGFDMKYAAKLFGLFQRLHSETEFEGAGSELALTRRIIERHGGTIRAEASKDHGATFHFTLPASLDPLIDGPARSGEARSACSYSDH